MMLLGAYVLSPALRQRVIAKRIAFLRPDSVHSAQELVGRIASVGRDFHAARVADITQFSLPALLRFEDRNSMAHSIEARVPYVDRGVISCGLRVPDEQLLQLHEVSLNRGATVSARPYRLAACQDRFQAPTQTWLGALSAQMRRRSGTARSSSVCACDTAFIRRPRRCVAALQSGALAADF
jgi:asparagine synthase (glutamine-hydrolysing)